MTQYGWLGVILGAIGLYLRAHQLQSELALAGCHDRALLALCADLLPRPDSALYLIPVWMFGAWAIARGLLVHRYSCDHITSSLRHCIIPGRVCFSPFCLVLLLNVLTLFPGHEPA